MRKCDCSICEEPITGGTRVDELDERGEQQAYHGTCWDGLIASELAITQDLALERVSA